jgi:hypothetical protein
MSESNVFIILSDENTHDSIEDCRILESQASQSALVDVDILDDLIENPHRIFSLEKMYHVLKQNNLLDQCEGEPFSTYEDEDES